jgi:hypothetical protein
MAYINPLALALGGSLMPTGQQPPEQPPMPKGMSKGQIIAGILSDALAGAMGKPGQFAQHLQRQGAQQQEDANWGRRLEQAEQIKARYREPDIPPMLRDAQAWQQMTPEQRQSYQQMKVAGAGDPDVFVTLPNGQVYAGPKSGLAQALTGGAAAPQKPVGRLTPLNGGPTVAPSGGFRPPVKLQTGQMTSGRRTPEGNRIVGGVPNSAHLTGRAVDYVGPNLNEVLREVRGLPGHRKSFIHKGHVHGEGDWAAEYYGKRGTRGLR